MLFSSSSSFFFFLTLPVYLLKRPSTNAPITFLNKWVTMRHVVAQITATPTEMQPLGKKSGCTLCSPFKRRASTNTAFTLQRQGSASLGEGVKAPLRLRRGIFFFPLPDQSVSAQLRVLCHERSAASLLNQTLHQWLVLGAFTLNSSNMSELM